MAGGRGSVCVLSSAERKYLTEKAIRPVLYVLGRETCVFGGKAISCVRTTNLPPEGGDLPEVIPRGRRGEKLSGHNYSFARSTEPGHPLAKAPPERSEGAERGGGWGCSEVYWRGPGGAANDGERGGRGGGRGAGTEYPVAVAGPVSVSRPASEVRGEDVPTDGWDSPPGRHGVYHDLEAEEGQYHV
jgi:hypothetical protein